MASADRRKPGPPASDPATRRTRPLVVLLTPVEYSALQEHVGRGNMAERVRQLLVEADLLTPSALAEETPRNGMAP
jgi:hypothetical protein